MSFKRSEVVRAEKEIEKAVHEYLKENSEYVFSEGEITQMLKDKNLISSEGGRYSRDVTATRVPLHNLCRKKKAEQHVYDGEVFYGVKEK